MFLLQKYLYYARRLENLPVIWALFGNQFPGALIWGNTRGLVIDWWEGTEPPTFITLKDASERIDVPPFHGHNVGLYADILCV